MTRQWIISIIFGTALYYLIFGMFVWPRSKCPCRGTWHSCPWCGGSGTHVTYGRQALNALTRKALGS